jgi:hypothetical protein
MRGKERVINLHIKILKARGRIHDNGCAKLLLIWRATAMATRCEP